MCVSATNIILSSPPSPSSSYHHHPASSAFRRTAASQHSRQTGVIPVAVAREEARRHSKKGAHCIRSLSSSCSLGFSPVRPQPSRGHTLCHSHHAVTILPSPPAFAGWLAGVVGTAVVQHATFSPLTLSLTSYLFSFFIFFFFLISFFFFSF